MGRPVAGLWSAIEDNSEVWRYITVNGLIFQHGVRDNMVCWDRLRVPAAARSGIAALMGLSGGRLNPVDETMWDAAVAELGGLPDMVRWMMTRSVWPGSLGARRMKWTTLSPPWTR